MSTKTYARIADGVVAELVTLDASLNIADCFHSDLVFIDVTSVSPEPQIGWIYTAPSTFAAPPGPSVAQQAATMLQAGCQIASTATPALNGTYACDPAAQQKIQATALYIQVNGKFPAGKTSMPWLDAGGAIHTFATTGEFLAFATAIGDYVTELEMVMLGQSTTLPTQPVTIA